MKKYITSRLVIAMVSIALVFFSISFFLQRKNSEVTRVLSPLNNIVSGVDQVMGTPFRMFGVFVNNISDLFKTYEENQQLKRELLDLKNQELLVEELKNENEELKSNLKFSDVSSDKVILSTYVTGRTSESWLSKITIAVGENDGVKEGMLALSDGGLVGQVTSVTKNSSTVSLFSDVKGIQKLPVKMSSGTEEIYAILEGFDKEKNSFVLSQSNSDATVNNGSKVVTSGLDGQTLANILVGEVERVENSDDSLSKKIYVKPAADFNKISIVTIVGD